MPNSGRWALQSTNVLLVGTCRTGTTMQSHWAVSPETQHILNSAPRCPWEMRQELICNSPNLGIITGGSSVGKNGQAISRHSTRNTAQQWRKINYCDVRPVGSRAEWKKPLMLKHVSCVDRHGLGTIWTQLYPGKPGVAVTSGLGHSLAI